MAQYQNQYDEVRQTDEYGKPVGQREEYGNPISHRTGATDGEYGSGTAGYGAATTEAGKYDSGTAGYGTATTEAGKYGGTPGSAGADIGREYNKEQPGKLHRSGSSGSSSSEDDGQGGRRKKGTKGKVPGTGRHGDDPSYATSTTPGGYDSAGQHQEKKGIMDKIKEKLPGRRNDDN